MTDFYEDSGKRKTGKTAPDSETVDDIDTVISIWISKLCLLASMASSSTSLSGTDDEHPPSLALRA